MDVGLREKLMRTWMPQPLGLSYFPKELQIERLLWGHTLGKVVLERMYERGGHSAAWECPEEVLRDLREMCGRGGGAAGAIDGQGMMGERYFGILHRKQLDASFANFDKVCMRMLPSDSPEELFCNLVDGSYLYEYLLFCQ